MKKLTGLIILAALAVMLSGCVINVGYGDYKFINDTDDPITVSVTGGNPSWFILPDNSSRTVKMSTSDCNYSWTPQSGKYDHKDTFFRTVIFNYSIF